MSQFWFFASLLLIAAIGFIWLPIIRYRRQFDRQKTRQVVSAKDINLQAYRSRLQELEDDLDQDRVEQIEYDALKLELERSLLGDTDEGQGESVRVTKLSSPGGISLVVGMALSIMTLVGAGALYWQLGSGPMLLQMEKHQALLEQMATMTPEQRLAMLRDQAEAEPQRAEIWYALAQGYLQTNKFKEAKQAYDRVLLLVGEDPQVLAEYAQALFFVNENRMDDSVRSLVDRALAVDPANDTALGLLGIDAFDREQYADAISYWQQIIDTMEPGEDAGAIIAGVERAKVLLAEQAGDSDGSSQGSDQKNQTSLLIKVSLSEELKKQALPQQTVFVYARALRGPPMPLAAVKLQVQDLPAEVVLNDQMAMSPQARMSQFDQVQVVARISKSQSATARAGDLQGQSAPINLTDAAASINILIDNIVE